MTGTQQLEQPGGTREYVPRHAWVESTDAPAAQVSAAAPEAAAPAAATPSATAPVNGTLLYETPPNDYAASGVSQTRVMQPYQRAESTSDYVTIVPERKRLWRGRKTA